MSTYYSDLYDSYSVTNASGTSTLYKFNSPRASHKGQPIVQKYSVTLPSGITLGSVAKILDLPEGAKLSRLSYKFSASIGTNGAFNLGFTSDPDGIKAAAAATSTTLVSLTEADLLALGASTAGDSLDITISTAASGAAAEATVTGFVEYFL